jgi:hypothetical protein
MPLQPLHEGYDRPLQPLHEGYDRPLRPLHEGRCLRELAPRLGHPRLQLLPLLHALLSARLELRTHAARIVVRRRELRADQKQTNRLARPA